MESEKDLGFYGKAFKKRWVIVLFFPLIVTIVSWYLSNYVFKSEPVFAAATTLMIGKSLDTSKPMDQLDVNTILAGPQMAKILEPLVKSRNVAEKVVAQLDLPLSVEQLNSKVQVNCDDGSDLIEIRVEDYDPEAAANIANTFAAKFSEVVVDVKKVNAIKVLDRAKVPDNPVINDHRQMILIAYFSSLMAALALAFFLEYRDDTLTNSKDIKGVLNLPVLGKIPYDSKSTNKKAISSVENNSTRKLSKKKFRVAEAYRTLRTNMEVLNAEHSKNRILITSTQHGEGKSLITVNLAISLVQIGKSVLIIDANLRNPIQHQLFGLTNEEGLSSMLVSKSPGLGQSVQTRIKGLDIFTAGPIPPNPTELLASENLKIILTDAAAVYDLVLIDSPPTSAIADVSIISQEIDGVLLVVGSGEVSQEYALEAKEQIEKVGANLVGVVLNKVKLKSKDNKYFYRYYKKTRKTWNTAQSQVFKAST